MAPSMADLRYPGGRRNVGVFPHLPKMNQYRSCSRLSKNESYHVYPRVNVYIDVEKQHF